MSNKANASQTQAEPLQQHLWNKTFKKGELLGIVTVERKVNM